MTGEEPQVRVDIQLGDQLALAILAADIADVNDAIDHQHVGGGKLRVTRAEQLAATAAQQVFSGEGVLFGHASSSKIPELQGCGGSSSGRRAGLLYRRRSGSLVIDCCVAVKVTVSGEQMFTLFPRPLAALVVDHSGSPRPVSFDVTGSSGCEPIQRCSMRCNSARLNGLAR